MLRGQGTLPEGFLTSRCPDLPGLPEDCLVQVDQFAGSTLPSDHDEWVRVFSASANRMERKLSI